MAQQQYRYTGKDPIGVDTGALLPGTLVMVRERVSAGTKGAHDNTTDSVVVEWPGQAIVRGPDGLVMGTTRRAMAVSVSDFDALFERTGE